MAIKARALFLFILFLGGLSQPILAQPAPQIEPTSLAPPPTEPPPPDYLQMLAEKQRSRNLLLHRFGLYGCAILAAVGLSLGTYELVQWLEYHDQANDLRQEHNDTINSSTLLQRDMLNGLIHRANLADEEADRSIILSGVGLGLGAAALGATIALIFLEPPIPPPVQGPGKPAEKASQNAREILSVHFTGSAVGLGLTF